MKLLDKLVLKDLVPQFFIGVGMFASLYFALGPLLAASRFISDGFSVPLVVKYMAFSILPILGLTFPMGILLAVLLGYGRLSGDSETVALFAGGIPFLRVAVPAAVLGLIVSGIGYIVNDPLASYANRQILDMKESAFHQVGESNKPFDLTIPFPGNENATQATLHIEEGFSLSARTMRNVTIVVYDANRQPSKIIHARSAHPLNDDIKSPAYTLQDVDINGLGSKLWYWHQNVMSTQDLKIEALAKPEDVISLLKQLQGDPNAFSFSRLQTMIRHLKAAGFGQNADVRFAEFSLWYKIALPLASLVFALVAAPLALRPQRTSKLTGWILSLPIILVYYLLYMIMSAMVRVGACPPLLGAFLPDIVGLMVGFGLVWRRSVS